MKNSVLFRKLSSWYFYSNISNALNELGVDLIAIGISDKADSSNVQYITGATFLHYDDTNPNKTAELVTAEISKGVVSFRQYIHDRALLTRS